LLTQTLENPPNTVYVYSDLSMITVHFVVGKLVLDLGLVEQQQLLPECQQRWATMGDGLHYTCMYEAFVRLVVFGPLGMDSTGFRPNASYMPNIAPTWNDTDYRHFLVQGYVSDENSYANGGISGHAGIFSTVHDLSKLALWYLNAPGTSSVFLNATTVDLWTKVHNTTQSSRALGWDTNAPNNGYHGCMGMSDVTFTHLGYTGTEICIDPQNGIFSVILDARVYPNKTANMDRIHTTRQAINSAIVQTLLH
jgi:serine-type D-Ala-D-Ala carboxypeptidase